MPTTSTSGPTGVLLTETTKPNGVAKGLAPVIPAAAFGIVLGIVGLANAWKAATAVWGVSPAIGTVIGVFGALTWLVLILCYGLKWLAFRNDALQELEHPVQCCFVGLIGVATMLVATVVLPFQPLVAEALFWLGALWTALFALWRTGALWRGGREPATTTAVLYLPTVAGSYVVAIAGNAFGYHSLAQLAFGAGFFSWLAIESVLLNRLLTAPELAEPIRPTIGIQLAPPTVGSVAYLSATSGMPDMLAHAMIGYGLLQAFLMIRILPWVLRQPFSAGYWAFSFGLTALTTAILRMVERGDTGVIGGLAMPVFIVVNGLIALLAILSVVLLLKGKLFPLRAISP